VEPFLWTGGNSVGPLKIALFAPEPIEEGEELVVKTSSFLRLGVRGNKQPSVGGIRTLAEMCSPLVPKQVRVQLSVDEAVPGSFGLGKGRSDPILRSSGFKYGS
jgi:hypothetical protein